jgi:phage terminase small subunit
MATPRNGLTDSQRLFVARYCVHLEAKRAAEEAGYSARNAKRVGYRLLHSPKIAAAIQEHQRTLAQRAEMDEKWVLGKLRENVERCMQAEPVLDRDGQETGQYRYDSGGAIRALELIGKHFAMWVDRVRVDELEQLSDEELDERIADLDRRAAAAATRSPTPTH